MKLRICGLLAITVFALARLLGSVQSRLGLILGAALVVLAGFSTGASAQTLTVLHSFSGSDGEGPSGGLIADAAGNLYGTTQFGGAPGFGTVFKVTPAGSETVLYSFCSQSGCSDGAEPVAGLIADAAGNLYGTTLLGGGQFVSGTVFKLTPSGTETVLHSFTAGGSDGFQPFADLIADAAGNLYGTTALGGTGTGCPVGCGTVFKVTPSGAETVLHRFTGGSDGGSPFAGLIADATGNLYGTTYAGGTGPCMGAPGIANGCGTVFKVTPAGAETVLHAFTRSPDGAYPSASLIADASGNLYGTTEIGGANDVGTVFKVTPSGVESVLYSFLGNGVGGLGGPDGSAPYAGLIADAAGNLYGTTKYGGNGLGTVFKVTASGAETVLHSFTFSEGIYPSAGLIADASGNLYGTTTAGGPSTIVCPQTSAGCGTVFKLAGSGFVPPTVFSGTPGTASCIGQSISSLAHTYGGIVHAVAVLGYVSVTDLQNAVAAYCGG